jgi:hypothetical protein
MLKQWEGSTGHRENLLMPGARRVGVAFVNNPGIAVSKIPGDGDHGLGRLGDASQDSSRRVMSSSGMPRAFVVQV